MEQFTKPIELASPNYIEIRDEAGSAITAGVLQSIDDVVAFAPFEDVAKDAVGVFAVQADRCQYVKADTEVFAAGDKIYYDPDEDEVRAVGSKESGDYMIGYAHQAAASADDYVLGSFEGRGVTAES